MAKHAGLGLLDQGWHLVVPGALVLCLVMALAGLREGGVWLASVLFFGLAGLGLGWHGGLVPSLPVCLCLFLLACLCLFVCGAQRRLGSCV